MSLGGKIGALVRGTILKYNNDGTVEVAVDQESGTATRAAITVPMPLAFSGPEGEFVGGCPRRGSSVILSQAQGEWLITGYTTSNNVFKSSNLLGIGGLSSNLMGELRPDRVLLQTKGAANRLYLDPKDGINFGTAREYVQADPKRGILSQTFTQELTFTAAHRSIVGPVKRDIRENSIRSVTGSILSSHDYDDTLFTIGMDPLAAVSTTSTSNLSRNLPLVESHEIIYEFQNYPAGVGYTTDSDEADRYVSREKPERPTEILRTDSRTNAFNLNLSNPNHLMEIVRGTGVDIYGNVLDLNRNPLPIGKKVETSLTKNPDKKDAFKNIRALHRKSLAFHWEINARKSTGDDISQEPNLNSKKDYARDRSRFFIDIDKEGQFKINVPSSSEIGNIPLLTRYENASTLLAAQGEISNPNAFVKEENLQDIFHEDFAFKSSIALSHSGRLDGYEAPIDRFNDAPIKYGTAYHDVTKTCSTFLETGRDQLINYSDNSSLNRLQPLSKIVSDVLYVAGPNANAGGRSGMINLDGFISLNVGANTADRQSAWFDFAGGIVSNIGRDRRGISYAASLDGDMLVQIGNVGVAGDSRFENENNAIRSGALDVRVVKSDGQLTIVRIDSEGVKVATYGRVEFSSQQSMIFRSNADILFEAENIVFYPESSPRIVKRNTVPEI